jgi:hypothetical protein
MRDHLRDVGSFTLIPLTALEAALSTFGYDERSQALVAALDTDRPDDWPEEDAEEEGGEEGEEEVWRRGRRRKERRRREGRRKTTTMRTRVRVVAARARMTTPLSKPGWMSTFPASSNRSKITQTSRKTAVGPKVFFTCGALWGRLWRGSCAP